MPDAIAQSMAKALTGRPIAFINRFVHLMLSSCLKHDMQPYGGLFGPLHAVCILFAKAGT